MDRKTKSVQISLEDGAAQERHSREKSLNITSLLSFLCLDDTVNNQVYLSAICSRNCMKHQDKCSSQTRGKMPLATGACDRPHFTEASAKKWLLDQLRTSLEGCH